MEALSTLYEYIKYYYNPNAGTCIKKTSIQWRIYIIMIQNATEFL